jgi:lipopolysaccharide transport system permease protein
MPPSQARASGDPHASPSGHHGTGTLTSERLVEADVAAAGPGYVEIRPLDAAVSLDLRELWRNRELTVFLAERDLRIRYKQTLLGAAWALIQPLTSVVIFSVIFGSLAGVPSDGLPYPVFAIAGLVVWLYFSTAVNAAANSLVAHASLVTKVYLPRVVAPAASALSGVVDFLIGLVLVAGAMVVYDVAPGPQIALLPLFCAWAVVVTFGVGLWLSALNVQYRDVRYASPFLLQVWLYASPVVFPTSLIEGWWRYLYALNPMVGVIDSVRWSFVGGPGLQPFHLISFASGLAIALSGLLYFRRTERTFADVI